MIKNIWNRLFLEERSSIGLSFFRLAVALTTCFHVVPTLFQLKDNYLNETSFRTFNASFFTIEFIELVQKSPDWLIVSFTVLFYVACFTFFVGFLSQLSCILTTVACYYFYALNAFHVGTLSWDILLVTLFLMCLTPYHGDYFSVDSLFFGKEDAYKRKRPYFIQRLLQMQLGFTFFYTAMYKLYPEGNWIKGNPIYFLMNEPPSGVTKTFLLRDFFMNQPEWCYTLGISILVIETLMIFLLFIPKTRVSAIYLGIFFHIVLVLTLDVPAIFFFLFPAQFLLFINPKSIVKWVEKKRAVNQSAGASKLVYDGNCQFCIKSLKKIQIMDLYGTIQPVNYQEETDIKSVHDDLTIEKASSQLHLIDSEGRLWGGFDVFRRISLRMPMLYPLILVFYFPGMGVLGPIVYKFVAKNRYLFHWNSACSNNSCFR